MIEYAKPYLSEARELEEAKQVFNVSKGETSKREFILKTIQSLIVLMEVSFAMPEDGVSQYVVNNDILLRKSDVGFSSGIIILELAMSNSVLDPDLITFENLHSVEPA